MMALHTSGRDVASPPASDEAFQPSPGYLFEDTYMNDMSGASLDGYGAADSLSQSQPGTAASSGQSG